MRYNFRSLIPLLSCFLLIGLTCYKALLADEEGNPFGLPPSYWVECVEDDTCKIDYAPDDIPNQCNYDCGYATGGTWCTSRKFYLLSNEDAYAVKSPGGYSAQWGAVNCFYTGNCSFFTHRGFFCESINAVSHCAIKITALDMLAPDCDACDYIIPPDPIIYSGLWPSAVCTPLGASNDGSSPNGKVEN